MKHLVFCLSARKVKQSRFSHNGGPVKLVQACFSIRKARESSFQECRGAVKLVQACLSAGNV